MHIDVVLVLHLFSTRLLGRKRTYNHKTQHIVGPIQRQKFHLLLASETGSLGVVCRLFTLERCAISFPLYMLLQCHVLPRNLELTAPLSCLLCILKFCDLSFFVVFFNANNLKRFLFSVKVYFFCKSWNYFIVSELKVQRQKN